VWKVTVDSLGRDVGTASLLIPFPIQGVISSDSWRFFIYTKGEDELWRVWTSTGKQERIGKAPFSGAAMWDVSADGKEILWVKYTSPSKLVLVKNVFE